MDEHMLAKYAGWSAVAREHGDEISAGYWWDQAERLSDQLEAARRRAEFDLLKGSPDHCHGDG